MKIEPGTTTTYDEMMTLHITCFASKGRSFKKSDLNTMAAKISGEVKFSQEQITHKDFSDHGRQIGFTLRVLSGQEYTFRPHVMDCPKKACSSGSCQQKSLILHFR